jgi:hypothetical protein
MSVLFRGRILTDERATGPPAKTPGPQAIGRETSVLFRERTPTDERAIGAQAGPLFLPAAEVKGSTGPAEVRLTGEVRAGAAGTLGAIARVAIARVVMAGLEAAVTDEAGGRSRHRARRGASRAEKCRRAGAASPVAAPALSATTALRLHRFGRPLGRASRRDPFATRPGPLRKPRPDGPGSTRKPRRTSQIWTAGKQFSSKRYRLPVGVMS